MLTKPHAKRIHLLDFDWQIKGDFALIKHQCNLTRHRHMSDLQQIQYVRLILAVVCGQGVGLWEFVNMMVTTCIQTWTSLQTDVGDKRKCRVSGWSQK